jgi:hypothetical protein
MITLEINSVSEIRVETRITSVEEGLCRDVKCQNTKRASNCRQHLQGVTNTACASYCNYNAPTNDNGYDFEYRNKNNNFHVKTENLKNVSNF